MSNATKPNVPASAMASFGQQTGFTGFAVNGKHVYPDNAPDADYYWFVVLDLKDLSVVANAVTENASEVPSSIVPYAGKQGYFLVCLSDRTHAYRVPTGALAKFLFQVGAGRELRCLEQMIEQLGTGTVVRFSYCLAATTDDGDLPGMEAMSVNGMSYLNIVFMPIYDSNNDFMGYAPGQLS